MNKRHKHAEIIKAWADGEEIEYQAMSGSWKTIPNYPSWDEFNVYRIKPKAKIVRWQWILPKDGGLNPSVTTSFYSDDEVSKIFFNADKMIKAEWTRMEFDE